ncbi:hypothetical protein RchiOBHm_Chr2g0132791 [Rosa chinensis]|uniref:Uncharacterized protein n=1 Tax=Rosa chinensis TaxID=74649 RepID=A0A2P6RVE9_ROSCH|nr:hypothetical protein RchiOBHm_Chr2g0132791 [Rosa chinensis]
MHEGGWGEAKHTQNLKKYPLNITKGRSTKEQRIRVYQYTSESCKPTETANQISERIDK